MCSMPSANILVAFCSDMPFICSNTLRGLSSSSNVALTHLAKSHLRICNRLNSIETSIYHELYIPR